MEEGAFVDAERLEAGLDADGVPPFHRGGEGFYALGRSGGGQAEGAGDVLETFRGTLVPVLQPVSLLGTAPLWRMTWGSSTALVRP